MPTGKEAVPNKALSGEELKTLLRADFEKLLDGEGLLSSYMAYGRVAYDLRLLLHLDNPMRPTSGVSLTSKAAAQDMAVRNPALEALDSPPILVTSPESTMSGTTLTRAVTSPNEERLRFGMPLPVEVKQQDGTVSMQRLQYPPQPTLGPGDLKVTAMPSPKVEGETADVPSLWQRLKDSVIT